MSSCSGLGACAGGAFVLGRQSLGEADQRLFLRE